MPRDDGEEGVQQHGARGSGITPQREGPGGVQAVYAAPAALVPSDSHPSWPFCFQKRFSPQASHLRECPC